MKVGFTASCFDLGPHAGHVRMLKEAKDNCDYLIVALHVNPASERSTKNVPVPALSERYLTLNACKFVDEIIPYETEAELENLIQLVRPSIRFIGEDYKGKEFTGKNIEGIDIYYCSRKHLASSSGTRAQIVNSYLSKVKEEEARRAKELKSAIKQGFHELNVGDVTGAVRVGDVAVEKRKDYTHEPVTETEIG